ncbi:3-deoxy-D-manno-octulosonic acid transferase [Hydrogenobaculum acidophilum]
MILELSKRLLIEHVNLPKNAVWFHTASIGEFNSIKFIIDFVSQKYPVFITYFSPRAKEFFEKIDYPSIPIPVDMPLLWNKFITTHSPRCLINVEKEFWPFLLKTKIPKALLNGRAPKNRLEEYLLGFFDMIVAKDEESFRLLKEINKNTFLCGNLKFSIDLQCDNLEKDSIVIGSTHEKEEELLLPTIKWILSNTDYKVIIAPRHISRSQEVLRLLEKEKIKASLKSQKEDRVIVLDTIGELKHYYKRATVSIVGGSFVEGYGGHNIVEPVSFCSYVLYGPYIDKIEDVASILESVGVGFRVRQSNILEMLKYCLESPFNSDKLLELSTYKRKLKSCYLELVENFVLRNQKL